MEPAGEEGLLEAARGGDAHALERLLEKHQGRVYRFGMKMCGRPEDAEDVLQETLLAAARSIRDFRGSSSFSTWLYAIARSHCIKKRRKSKFAPKRSSSLDDDDAPEARGIEDPGRSPDEAAFANELMRALDRAIGALDHEQREVLLLRDVEGLKASEVAEVLGISTAAVKSRLHRARLRVREQLAPLLESPAPDRAEGVCPDVASLLSRHLEGEISTEDCAEMERHVKGCPRCGAACDSLRQMLSLCRRLPPGDVPMRVQQGLRSALRAPPGSAS